MAQRETGGVPATRSATIPQSPSTQHRLAGIVARASIHGQTDPALPIAAAGPFQPIRKEDRVPVESAYDDVEILQHTCPDVRTYRSVDRLSERLVSSVDTLHRGSLTGKGRRVFDRTQLLLGVVRISVHGNELTVAKGAAFDWEEIEPKVLRILRRAFSGRHRKTEPKILITRPRENVWIYHTTIPLTPKTVTFPSAFLVSDAQWAKLHTELSKALPERTLRIVEDLAYIDLLGAVRLERYSVRVEKRPDNDWGILDGLVRSILRHRYPVHEADVYLRD